MQLAASLAYIFVPWTSPVGVDPTQFTVDIALCPDDGREPASGDFHAAVWMSPGGTAAPKEAALLVGPGGAAVYAAGEYMAFARITAGAERPVFPAGRVRIGNTGI
jgi:hypothetical protein